MEVNGKPALELAGSAEKGACACWPSAESVTRPGWAGLVKRAKYQLRMLLSAPLRPQYLQAVARHPAWRELHRRHPECYYPALSHFLDRRFGLRHRFQVALADLRQAEACFGPHLSLRLAHGDGVALWALTPDCQVTLSLNEVSWHEGRWMLSLRDGQGRRLYSLSFGFLPCGALLVGTVQGPRPEVEDVEERIRELTKSAEGLRPPYLLFEALRAAAAAWGVSALVGIDPAHHVKGRWNLRSRRLRFDYRRFWSEVGASQRGDGYWQAGLQPLPRDLAEVPSRKRAMYRRRWAMLGDMAQSLQDALRAAR
ncbi:DUF535 family protein [uncultured Azohydromonas sp.]|jgi:Uncharacterized protein conserved in bacteria|uniref:VirK/YbjX family protein n=1 Tax=uncultured Azohydromonas sp. TaxID=487342 RepID=UPI00261E7AC0|nr:DUF535 family protein [uncultured Azohydromonas sp.]